MSQHIREPVDQQAPQNEALNLSIHDNYQLEQVSPQVESQYMSQQQRSKFINCGQVVKRLQLCQILIVFLNLLVVSLLAIIFSLVGSLQYLQLHASIAIIQAFVLVFHSSSIFLLKHNIKQLDNNLPRKAIRYQLKFYLWILLLASIAGVFLFAKMLKSAIVSENMNHQLSNYDSIIILSDLLFSIFGLQILAIFFLIALTAGMVFYILLLIIHFFVWIISNRQILVLGLCKNWLLKQMNAFYKDRQRGLKKFMKRIDFSNAQEQRKYQNQNCSICLESFADKQKIYELPCLSQNAKHSFHSQCLQKWMVNSRECPNCRTSLGHFFEK